ncbi:hypothetical protein HAX54_000553 [Datura stramonium]|uniref:Uncharacterized protein n=1 Tax=Datura stramonium TaxID=4076 RepID=A0ABS8T2D2_DATST|nr:hypothetical protein [Datura stramonium]
MEKKGERQRGRGLAAAAGGFPGGAAAVEPETVVRGEVSQRGEDRVVTMEDLVVVSPEAARRWSLLKTAAGRRRRREKEEGEQSSCCRNPARERAKRDALMVKSERE